MRLSATRFHIQPWQMGVVVGGDEGQELAEVFLKSKSRSKRQKPPKRQLRGFFNKSLTMTYFHTGCSTIIGAKSFHGPVRDGKGWFQLAIVTRRRGLIVFSKQSNLSKQFGFESYTNMFLITSNTAGYRIKSNGQLVSVSLTHYCASTPDLSTSWSSTTLYGG